MTPLRDRKFLVLLILLTGALIGPSLHHPVLASAPMRMALQTVIVAAVFLGVFEQKSNRIVVLVFGIVTAAVGWSAYALPLQYHPAAAVAGHILRLIFIGYAAAVILGDIFRKKFVRVDDVLGAACGYLLASVAWANLYQVCELLSPGSFTFAPGIHEQFVTPEERLAVFEYFSLATLTTVGYGDITPARGPATMLAMLEPVFGQFYIAVVVAELIGMRLAQGIGRLPDK
jgi:voltage-gated potassium channel